MEQLKPSLANSSPLTPLNFLERTATVYGDCISIVYDNLTYTWNDTHLRCLRVASSIQSMGIKKGQVVSVVAPNIPAMYELHFAVPMAGAILNTINTRLDARTISTILCHSESKLVFIDYQLASLVLEALSLFPETTQHPRLVLITESENPSYSTSAIEFVCTYESMVTKGDSKFKWVRPDSEWDPVVLNYTSGTTSSPKGVVHHHRGIYLVTMDTIIEWSIPKTPMFLWTLPMFHCNGWCLTWAIAAVGGTNVCLRRFDASTIYARIRKHNITHMCCAPVVLNMLSKKAKPLEKPVQILTGGSSPPAKVLSQVEFLGFIVTHGYGMTELGGTVVSCTWKSQWDRLLIMEKAKLKARQGVRLLSAMSEVNVIEPNSGVVVKRDGLTQGEIVVKGGCVMLGYLKDHEGTSKCMRANGWFYTGDVGVIHPDGYLEIKDRSKDVIITGGENVSSVEVESILYTHPMVNEVAVVARPDKFWGETPCAFVSLNTEKFKDQKPPTEDEIVDFCRAKMPHYMVPKTVLFEEELPKTSTGKIQKFVLREVAKALGSKSSRKSCL